MPTYILFSKNFASVENIRRKCNSKMNCQNSHSIKKILNKVEAIDYKLFCSQTFSSIFQMDRVSKIVARLGTMKI